jgi:hypothetical protein
LEFVLSMSASQENEVEPKEEKSAPKIAAEKVTKPSISLEKFIEEYETLGEEVDKLLAIEDPSNTPFESKYQAQNLLVMKIDLLSSK